MNIKRKMELVKMWGFYATADSCYVVKRDIFASQGYVEQWSPVEPDEIQFYKDGKYSHNYMIDWSLFGEETV